MKVKILIAVICIILMSWFLFGRVFIHNRDRTQCMTIWRTIGGKCYIIPGKYYSLFPPKNNFISTHNTAILYIAWESQGNWRTEIAINKKAFVQDLDTNVVCYSETINFSAKYLKSQELKNKVKKDKRNDVERLNLGNLGIPFADFKSRIL